MLTNTELKILTALHGNPQGNINSLSKSAKMSSATFIRNLKKLQTEGILDKGGFVSAQIAYSAVGLEVVTVFADALQKNWTTIEEMCEIHPYSIYRTRCFGSTNGIFAIFAVPTGSVSYLISIFDILKKKEIFSSYHMHRLLNQQIYTEADFRLYDNKTGIWNFNWDLWEKTINEKSSFELQEFPPSIIHQMNAIDMQILRHLSIDARKERKEIAQKVGIPAYHLSRRLKFYRKNQVNSAFRILFGLTSLNLITPALVECVVDSETKNRIGYAISKLPFQGNFIPTETGFILYLILPPSDFPKLASAVLKNVGEANLMWCDYAKTVRYWFDSGEKSNFRDGHWLATKDFLLDKILNDLKLE